MTTLSGVEDGEAARGLAVQHVAHGVLELAELDDVVGLGHADPGNEVAQALGRETAPAHPGDRGHARIVPAAHVPLVDQAQQDALGEDGVGDVEPGELDLAGLGGHRQVLDEPVVQGPVDLELQAAERVRDALDRVRLAVREVVHRVDGPLVAGARMLGVQDPVQHRVAQVDVRRGHVDPGAQHPRPVGELARPHPLEEIEVLLDRPIAIGAVPAGLGERAAVLADLVGR